MKGHLFLNNHFPGEIDFIIIDESMGAVGGALTPSNVYEDFKEKIQSLCDRKGIANSDDLNFEISFHEIGTINPEGGIGITDTKGLDEIQVEAAGISADIIQRFKSH